MHKTSVRSQRLAFLCSFLQALSCAAIDDVLAWCVLALASSFAKSGSAILGLWTTLAAAGYVIFMVVLLRPVLAIFHRYLIRKKQDNSRYYVVFVFLLLLGSAFTTEGLGIHCFFGGFVMGLIVPKENGFADSLVTRMDLVVSELQGRGLGTCLISSQRSRTCLISI